MSIRTRSSLLSTQQIIPRIAAAKTAYQNIWLQYEPPVKIGKTIKIHPQNMQVPCIQEAWHGSSLQIWEHQILKGRVNHAANLYFGNIDIATKYALMHKDPILIHLKIKSGVIRLDESYGTDYVQGKYPSEVFIARAYHVNEDYLRFAEDINKPKIFDIYKLAIRAAINGFIEYPQENFDS